MRAGSLTLLVLLLASGPGCERAPELPMEEGVPLALAEFRSAAVVDPRFDVSLSIPGGREEPVTGTVRVELLWEPPRSAPLVLDFREAEERILAVRVNGRETRVEVEHDHLLIPGETLLRNGRNTVEVEFVAGDGSLNRSDDFLYSLFVPDRAHTAIPLFDQPDIRARYRLRLELPAGWAAVSNGRLAEERAVATGGDGAGTPGGATRRTVRFAETEPIPSYLLAFAAGRFESVSAERDGRTLTLFHRETDRDRVERNLREIFDLHATALEWLEEYTGIDHPFQKFEFVAIPDFQYGGMEHPGAIFYRDRSLFLDEAATQGERLGRASLIAHETAHMWFGNLVTMRWFDDVWTKEVFANFMAARIVHPSFPELDHDLRFLLSHHPLAYAVDRSEAPNAIRQPLANLKEAGMLYGPIIYQKAPVVMRQLEALLGEEEFRDGIREYLERFAFANATWPELIEILDRRWDGDLEAWSRVWVEEPGRPVVRVHLEVEGGGAGEGTEASESGRRSAGESAPAGEGATVRSMALEQEDPAGRGRIWPQRLSPVLFVGDGASLPLHVELLEERVRVPGVEGAPAPRAVLPDGSGYGYGRFELDEGSRGWLRQELPRLDEPIHRAAGLLGLWDELLQGEVHPEEHLDLLLRMVERETDEQILRQVLGQLETTWWRFLTPREREERAEEVLWGALEAAGEESERASLFATFRRVAVSPGAVERLRRIWWEEEDVPGLRLSERDRTALAFDLALREVEDAEEILRRQEAEITNPDRRARFRFLLPSVDGDPGVRDAFFEDLTREENRRREPWVLDGLEHLHHPLRAPGSRAYIRPALELTREIQRTGDIFFPARWLGATLGGHSSPEAARAVREFLEEHPDHPEHLREKILQAADPLFRASRIVHGEEV